MAGEHTTFSYYDTVNHLRDEQDMREYLDAALNAGEPAMITVALNNIERAKALLGSEQG